MVYLLFIRNLIVAVTYLIYHKNYFSVSFRAGSRYEPQTELGLAHVLRSAAGLTTKNASAYIIRRQLAQIGASFTASGDREFIYYTVEVCYYFVFIYFTYKVTFHKVLF